jgi:alkylhydroperoxidase family enzyme
MPLIPYVDPKSAPQEVRELLDVLPDLHLFKMVGHAPTLFGPWLALGAALLASLELDPVLRELAILQLASTLDCEYERIQHGTIAEGVGATSEQVALLALPIDGRSDAAVQRTLSASQQAVISFTDKVVSRVGVSPDEVADLRDHLSDRSIVELLLVFAHYAGIAMLAETVHLDLDASTQMAVVDLASGVRINRQ